MLTASGRAATTRLNTPGGLLLIMGATHAISHAFGGLMPLIFPMVVTEFALTYTDIGFIVGFTTFAGGMMQLIYGVVSRYVLRKVILAVGQLVIGLSCVLTGLANGYGLLFLGNLGARLGGSPQHPVGNSLLVDRLPASERGSALSLHVVGGNVGTVLVPIVGGALLTVVGWRVTLFLLAIPAFLLTLAVLAFVHEQKGEVARQQQGAPPTRHIVREVFTNRTILLIMLASVIGAAGRGLSALNTYLPLYLSQTIALPTGTVNILYACLLIGGVAGPYLLGRLSDQVGRRIVLYLTYAGATVAILIFVGLGAAAPLLLGLVLLIHGGFSHSDSVILTTYLADVVSPRQRDVVFSIFFTVAFGVGALWPAVFGYIADTWGLTMTFIAFAVTYLAAGITLLPIREKASGCGEV